VKILLANPNTTEAITQHMARTARAIASLGTEIVTATAAFGAPVIATRAQMAVAEHASLDMISRHAPGTDAVIIGASLDSGLAAAREALSIPVIGITQAALHTACLLGGRFGVICTNPTGAAITRDMIEAYGLLPRLAGLAWLDVAAADILADPEGSAVLLADQAGALIARDLASSIVLIGAVMAGMPTRMQSHLPVPVLEGVSCAAPLAEALVRLRATA
jgi:allantoin racemase